MNKIKVSIFGATGYVGVGLYQYLVNREDIDIVYLISNTFSGKKYSECIGVFDYSNKYFLKSNDTEKIIENSDIIFTALPNGESMNIASLVKNKNKILIDLSADFRLKNLFSYKKWYKIKHSSKELIKEAVYSIPELHRNKIKDKTWLISNPGCYPTSIQLPLAPILKEGFIDENNIIIDSKSGISGAGRNNKNLNNYCDQSNSVIAYNTGIHRHKPEMETYLEEYSKKKVNILFSPHIVPMPRGIFSSIYCVLKKDVSEKMIFDCLQEKYINETFVEVLNNNILLNTKWIIGTNMCYINFILDKYTNKLILFSIIDNLGKGACGQAIQNMNKILNIEEKRGLIKSPCFP